jgi:hypothetical protein
MPWLPGLETLAKLEKSTGRIWHFCAIWPATNGPLLTLFKRVSFLSVPVSLCVEGWAMHSLTNSINNEAVAGVSVRGRIGVGVGTLLG